MNYTIHRPTPRRARVLLTEGAHRYDGLQDVEVAEVSQSQKRRHIVLTDIGCDPDDRQSLVRLLVHNDEFDIEGIVTEQWSHSRLEAAEQQKLVQDYIDAYALVWPMLRRHSVSYADPEGLHRVVARGAERVRFAIDDRELSLEEGSQLVGADRDTEGSELVRAAIERDDPRPLTISVWGGTADLAQALWRTRHHHTEEETARLVARLRVHAISDQDATGPWIRQHFPDLFYIWNHDPNGDKMKSCYRGMYLGGDESLTSAAWIEEHVHSGHGPLGALYPMNAWTGPNPHGCMKEGDTPSWMYFLRNRLNATDEPSYGGWGGRFAEWRPGQSLVFRDAPDTLGSETSGRITTSRWRAAVQNHFSARMDRCVRGPDEVNEAPVPMLNGERPSDYVTLPAVPGEETVLDADGTFDPHGSDISFSWWIYHEAGTASISQSVESSVEGGGDRYRLRIPPKASPGENVHVILEVTNSGTPPLTSYARTVLTVR